MPPRARPRKNPVPADPPVDQPAPEEPPIGQPGAPLRMDLETLYEIERRFRERRPPLFNGLKEPHEAEQWVRTIDKIFDYMRCPEEAKMTCALFQLTEEADYWWESVQRVMTPEEKELLTWDEFKLKFNDKYVPQSYRDGKEAEFLNLKQGTKTVTEYDRAFNQLSRYAPYLVDTEEKKADRFRRGLIPGIGMSLVGHGRLSYAETLKRALDIEALIPRSNKPSAPTGQSSDNKRKWNDPQANRETMGWKFFIGSGKPTESDKYSASQTTMPDMWKESRWGV